MGDRPNPLSPRELQALERLADGLTRAQIAAEWGVSVGTVHNHLRLVHAKLGVRSTSQAIAVAFRNGWLE
ncbi:MAG: LuxR C-terminal-related transcriptional regulator [Chloroflexota bacterium]|nr:LuxR C-terminal-related transcriptional regulator [Chloroflexota bacterium]